MTSLVFVVLLFVLINADNHNNHLPYWGAEGGFSLHIIETGLHFIEKDGTLNSAEMIACFLFYQICL